MANQRITMQKLHKLIELHLSGKSQRQISRLLGIHRRTVNSYLTVLTHYSSGDLSALQNSDEGLLWQIVTATPSLESLPTKIDIVNLFPEYEKKLAKVGMTKYLLWEDYRDKHSGKLSYSRFCRVFSQWQRNSKISLHITHKAGDKLFIDFAGSKLYLTDSQTNEKIAVEVFVAVLGYSQLTYCQAVMSQKKPDFLLALSNALSFYGGVPQAIVPDNLKSAVTKADRYEPDLNESLADFADHYQTTIYPTRSHRPKDKALVEKTVNILYTRIYTAISERIFTSLTQLNEAIRERLNLHNITPLQGKTESRQSLYDELEQATLQPLPSTRYELRWFRDAKVHPNCHVKLSEDKHYYSVPYKYVGKTVQLRYTQETVEIYADYQRIAIHERIIAKNGYTTLKEHLHPSHQWVMNWSPEFFETQATKIGQHTLKAVQQLLLSRKYPEQAYKSCAGVLALAKKVGNQRLENACERALAYEYISAKLIQSILDRDLDKVPITDQEPTQTPVIPLHPNIRGASNYQ
jgi:transposase